MAGCGCRKWLPTAGGVCLSPEKSAGLQVIDEIVATLLHALEDYDMDCSCVVLYIAEACSSSSIVDANADVRGRMINAGIMIIDEHGNHNVSFLFLIFENYLNKKVCECCKLNISHQIKLLKLILVLSLTSNRLLVTEQLMCCNLCRNQMKKNMIWYARVWSFLLELLQTGSLLAFECLCDKQGKLVEPYVIYLLP